MKIAAVGQRGTRRVFIDLYFLCQQGFTLEGLWERMPQKFPNVAYPSYHLLRALAYFDDADRDELAKMLKPAEWKTVRDLFSLMANRLLGAL